MIYLFRPVLQKCGIFLYGKIISKRQNVSLSFLRTFEYLRRATVIFFDVLLSVHLSIFISKFNQLDTQNLFHNKFYFMPLHVSITRD